MRFPHRFSNKALLTEALTHASWVHEHGGSDNERLEFLGDAILNMCTTLLIYERFPDVPEGQLTRLRSKLVNTGNLAEIGRALELGMQLRMGKGEEASGGRTKERMLENAVEAVIGAVFLDAGIEQCRRLIALWMGPRVDELGDAGEHAWKDARSMLQERTQARHQQAPTYVLVEQDGPAHNPVFTVEVRLGDMKLGRGRAHSKREASRLAAENALKAGEFSK